MPFALYMLGLAVFAMGTSEFMLSGLIPDIAHDLHVTVPAAGSLTSAFAVGMVIGAPLMAVIGMRWSRRAALLLFLVVFLAAHAMGALTDSFDVLLMTRVLSALANAGFLAVSFTAAAGMVPPNAKGRAAAVLLGGVTLACVAGVPGGALLGQYWGWRSAFWAVVVLSAPAVLAVALTVPAGRGDGPAPTLRDVRAELGVLRRRRPLLLLALCALVNGGTFCTFTYLAPLVTGVSGIPDGWVPGVLTLFGLGSFAGVSAAGRLADTRPVALLAWGTAVHAVGWAVFALGAGSPEVVLPLVLLQGALAFAIGSTLVTQVLYAGADAPTLAGAGATAAFNVGASLGPWLGGVAIAAGHGYRSPVWVSAGLVSAALVTGAVALAAGRRGRRADDRPREVGEAGREAGEAAPAG
ncbi:Cmx/CmrA family chloramphenicol efflux MFS transporter [Streptomyces sp. SID4919]|uniref:Cmx/CmrA family chloramphenicol efflux MFS transporter n=1 Tax=unclassified Streptomyces TaxID=2593676 RepID=UPI0008239AE9|nr:Cmx/CmrA family chloramphenicol efflux MFS transporter [Streptomyces sp. AmelKG-E11A]MYY09287.1 Cmx/CmrA family chloramphenicol efflux MFS transporter [Streptomyces sp. SID4919]SCK42454.1 MFS transporter, DHA1 family, chloramphenicol resistance protein [Streptomyces sp. AmelKG-E11A]